MSKLKVLLDTNVLLTYITSREDDYITDIEKIMDYCANEKIEGYIAFHSISIIWYVTRKYPDEKRRQWIRELCELLTVVAAEQSDILEAISQTEFADFEDCLQVKCARKSVCDFIITVNIKDFGKSEIPAVTPNVFLTINKNGAGY